MHDFGILAWPPRANQVLCGLALVILVAGLATTLEYRRAVALQSIASADFGNGTASETPCPATLNAGHLPKVER